MPDPDHSIPLVALVSKYAAGSVTGEAVNVELRKHEHAFGVELRVGDTSAPLAGYQEIPDGDLPAWSAIVEGSFFQFLDQTHALMHGMYVSDRCHVLVGGRYRITATARAWGQIYADWANSRDWLGKSDWTYMEFYTGSISPEFTQWTEAFYHFLERRSA